MNYNPVVFLVLSSSLLSGSVLAGGMGVLENQPVSQWVATASLGADLVKRAAPHTLTLLPPFQNYYTVSGGGKTLADGGLFLGIEKRLSSGWSAQVGVAGYLASSQTIRGDIWQFSLPEFDNLRYQYRVHHGRLMASGKLMWLNEGAFLPYVSGELGVGWNRARGYQEIPLLPQAVPMAPFASHRDTSLVYAAGLGVDYQLNSQVRLGMGWHYADLGKASLGLSPAQQTLETLHLSHRYANQLRLQLSTLV